MSDKGADKEKDLVQVVSSERTLWSYRIGVF